MAGLALPVVRALPVAGGLVPVPQSVRAWSVPLVRARRVPVALVRVARLKLAASPVLQLLAAAALQVLHAVETVLAVVLVTGLVAQRQMSFVVVPRRHATKRNRSSAAIMTSCALMVSTSLASA